MILSFPLMYLDDVEGKSSWEVLRIFCRTKIVDHMFWSFLVHGFMEIRYTPLLFYVYMYRF